MKLLRYKIVYMEIFYVYPSSTKIKCNENVMGYLGYWEFRWVTRIIPFKPI